MIQHGMGIFSCMAPPRKNPLPRGGVAAGWISSSAAAGGGCVASLASAMPWEEGDGRSLTKYRQRCHAAIVRGYYCPKRRCYGPTREWATGARFGGVFRVCVVTSAKQTFATNRALHPTQGRVDPRMTKLNWERRFGGKSRVYFGGRKVCYLPKPKDGAETKSEKAARIAANEAERRDGRPKSGWGRSEQQKARPSSSLFSAGIRRAMRLRQKARRAAANAREGA